MDGGPQEIESQGEHMGAKRRERSWGSSFDLGIREGVGFFVAEGIVQTLIESVESRDMKQ